MPAVQAVLGHATPSETLDTYTHFWINDTTLTREAIGAAFASLRLQTAAD